MTDETDKTAFLKAADAWVCDGYSLDMRFLAGTYRGAFHIWDAAIALVPLPAERDHNLKIDFEGFSAGQVQRTYETKTSLFALLTNAASGVIELPDREAIRFEGDRLDFYTEMTQRDRWFSDLHLQVGCETAPPTSPSILTSIDNSLRKLETPFDGLADLASWLDLKPPGGSGRARLTLRVSPPADLRMEHSELINDKLRLTLHAHPKFNVQHLGLAVRTVPGNGLNSRFHAEREVSWGLPQNGRRVGTAEIKLQNADSVLVMLTIGMSTVRRQWFFDPAKARNNRYLAVQHFDTDLRRVRNAVMESTESIKFENGIAALLFLLGFSPAVQLETDSPDLIVTTPGGRLAIVECTTRIADFGSKLGKLVDRRGALAKSLQASGHPTHVSAVLVCRLPRDQIAADTSDLQGHKTILLSGDDLLAAFDRVRFPNDPDKMLEEAEAQLSAPSDLFSN